MLDVGPAKSVGNVLILDAMSFTDKLECASVDW